MQGAEPTAKGAPASGRLLVLAGVAAYVVCAVLLNWPLLAHPASRSFGGSDADLFAWWLRWTPSALLHGHSPLTSPALFAPSGINGMWNTSVPVLGVLAAPLTLAFGPLVSLNVLISLAPVLSASVVLLLARRYVRTGPAFVAGLLYGFSTYVLGQGIHLHLTFAVFPPVLLALLLEAVVHQRARPVRLGLLLGVVTGLQLLLGEELLASSALLAALSLGVLGLVHRAQVRAKLGYLARVLGVGFGAALVLDAVPLYTQFMGPQRVHGAIQGSHPGADLLGFFVPTPFQALHTGATVALAQHVQGGNLAEQTAYVGVPLFALVALASYRLRRAPERWLLVPLVVAVVLALGSSLHVDGYPTHIPLPARFLSSVPVLNSLIPVRFTAFVFLFAALLVAVALDRRADSANIRGAQLALLALAVAALLPGGSRPTFPADVPRFFRSSADLALIPTDSPVLIAPWPSIRFASPMLWQAASGMRFRLVGGYGVVPGADGTPQFQLPPPAVERVVESIARGQPAPPTTGKAALTAVRELHALRVRVVLVTPMSYQVQAAAWLSALLGTPTRMIDGVELLVLPSGPQPSGGPP